MLTLLVDLKDTVETLQKQVQRAGIVGEEGPFIPEPVQSLPELQELEESLTTLENRNKLVR